AEPSESAVMLGEIVYPSKVLPGHLFQVNVSVIHSCRERAMTNIGLFSRNSGNILDPRIIYLTGNGTKNILFELRAPNVEGLFELEVLLRYWHLGFWVYNKEYLRKPISIRILDQVQLRVSLFRRGVGVEVDGLRLETDDSGVAQTILKVGRHLVKVPQKIDLTADTRLVFSGWSDGSVSNPRIVEAKSDLNLDAEYEPEYYLTVDSRFGVAYGGGWYPAGLEATISISSIVAHIGSSPLLPERYMFKGWVGDINATTPTVHVKMTSPISVKALWVNDEFSRMVAATSLIIIAANIAIIIFLVFRRRLI
ncbi:hypothetical protein KEJ23_00275, partial [Candidatus Bathyarchaeota archaeon]|nr:hypothetical protein [Candidatus Bathyarchaeota archaeon]